MEEDGKMPFFFNKKCVVSFMSESLISTWSNIKGNELWYFLCKMILSTDNWYRHNWLFVFWTKDRNTLFWFFRFKAFNMWLHLYDTVHTRFSSLRWSLCRIWVCDLFGVRFFIGALHLEYNYIWQWQQHYCQYLLFFL